MEDMEVQQDAEQTRRIRLVKAKMITITSRELGRKGEKVVNKLREAPETEEGLRNTVRDCRKLISLTIDEKMGKQLENICLKLLDER